jgi:hypothetical protein
MMTGSGRDDEFEAYLKRRGRIDRRLKSLDRLEPPAELDRIIIGHAREAIHGPIPVGLFRAPRWALPMGMAATILISLSILLDLGMKGAMQRDASWGPRAARMSAAVAPSAVAPRIVTEMEPAPGPAPAPAAAPAAMSPSASVTFARPADRTRTSPIKTAPWPLLPRIPAAAPTETASAKAAPLAGHATDASSTGDDTRSRVSEHLLATSRVRTAPGASGSGSAELVQASSPYQDHMEIVTVIGTRTHQTYAAAATPVTSISSEASETLSSPYVPDTANIQPQGGMDWAAERHWHPNPLEWLDHIKKMRAAGLKSEADQELRFFHDAYPGFRVPPATPATDGGTQ